MYKTIMMEIMTIIGYYGDDPGTMNCGQCWIHTPGMVIGVMALSYFTTWTVGAVDMDINTTFSIVDFRNYS